MTNRPPNGGSSEYFNLISGITNIKTLLDDEFAKKLQNGDLFGVVAAIGAITTPTLNAIAANNIVPFQRTNVGNLVNQVGSIGDDIAQSAGNIVRGGIGGLVQLGKVLLGVALKIIGVTLAILMSIFFIETEIQRIAGVVNELLSLRDRVAALEAELTGLRDSISQGFQAVNDNVVAVNSNLEQAQSNIARGIRMTAASTNELLKRESLDVKRAVDSVKGDLSDQIESFQAESRTEWLNNREWQFNNRAAAIATLTVAGVNAPDGLLDKTKKAVDAVSDGVGGINNRVREGFDDAREKFKRLGKMINIGQIIDVITLIGVIHNASMLSRSLLETLFSVVDNGLNAALNAFNVKGLEEEGVDSRQAFGQTVDAIGRSIFGVEAWAELKAKWAAANRIVTTGSTLLWSVRDLMDNTQNLAEIAAENSAKVGNALRRAGQVFDAGAWFPENYNYRTLMHRRLTNLNEFLSNSQNLAQVFEEIPSTTIEIQENIQEINENNEKFQKALKEGEKVIRDDNKPVKDEEDAAKRKPNQITEIQPSDLERAD